MGPLRGSSHDGPGFVYLDGVERRLSEKAEGCWTLKDL